LQMCRYANMQMKSSSLICTSAHLLICTSSMVLSIIIVNYNVKHFLEQCLCSVKKALDLSAALNSKVMPFAEVLVIDNHSTDGSIEYLEPRFPFAQFIVNSQNIGFSKANNQALELVKGRYVLFLNPDTILPEDIFQKTIAFMEARPDAGMLGVQMVDGTGEYLKESKRGLPTPWASFCKMSGLTAAFPYSPLLARYYLGHLKKQVTQEVEVLAGAFILARREVLDRVGGFDEQFFMYAEDIDLSYRVLKAGFHNYYFADATILHFKGESTRKDARYVKLFYKAMRQFVRKHGGGFLYRGMLNAAIYLRTGLSMLRPHGSIQKTAVIEEASLKGDADTVKQLKPLLHHMNIEPDSDVIIFCEGRSFPFHEVISSVQKLNGGQLAMVHANGSGSIVGSWDKNRQGVIIPINNR